MTVVESAGGLLRRWSTSDRAYPLGYVHALDGGRGLMTLGVMAAHTRPALVPGASLFMDVFFVMSGYLITSLLINDYRKRGWIDFKKFYTRRFMRLYPALALMLFAVLCGALLFSSALKLRLIEATAALSYITNYWIVFGGPGVWYTPHTWSLSIEEQFYLLWPLAFALMLRWFDLSWRVVGITFCAAMAFALWRIWLTYTGGSIDHLHLGFDTRADDLLIGGALAVALKLVDIKDSPRLCKVLATSHLPLTLLLVAGAFFISDHDRSYYYAAPLAAGLGAALMIAALNQPNHLPLRPILEHPVPVFCGRICYGLYIWNYPIIALLRYDLELDYFRAFLIGWPLNFALAIGSYYLIERHFMKSRPL
jgi:peptidoglycan/LPS O-acetylase OafA/YrhL